MIDVMGVNIWAVLIVWVLYMALGAFWYSTAGFAKQWTKHTGVNILKIPQDKATKILMFIALSAFVQALTLGVILHSLHITMILDGLFAAVFLWLGLTAATTVGVTLYSGRSWKFLWLNSSYFLLVMSLGSMIFTTWQ